jgi:hypothetical protein
VDKAELPCYKYAGTLMGVKDADGKVPQCEGDCKFKHKPLHLISAKEASTMMRARMEDKTYLANFKAAKALQWPPPPQGVVGWCGGCRRRRGRRCKGCSRGRC